MVAEDEHEAGAGEVAGAGEREAGLEVQLLGTAQVHLGAESIRFAAERRYQLLAHLAIAADWVGRDRLAYLFWPDHPQPAARRNLRKVIHAVRALPWLRGFESSNRGERWLVASDVDAFRRAVEVGDWEGALARYRGPLLQGLDGAGSEFDLWLAVERERLQADWRDATLRRAEELERSGRPRDALRSLRALLGHDPFDEHVLDLLMRAAARGGDRDAALRAYRDFEARLAEQLEIEPAASLQELAREIARGEAERDGADAAPAPPRADAALPAALPTVATSFVGRIRERAEAARLLRRADCRLVSVVGAGGVGKTRLALEVARDLAADFEGGAHFVPLETLASAAAVPVRIAERLGLRLDGDVPAAQLLRALGERKLLLVLDNYEHLLAGAPFVAGLLRECPGIRVLVTSRERLDLREEWMLPLTGLAVPEDGVPLAEAARYDAVRLFVERARQLRREFALEAATLPDVLVICRLLDGSPLALELAAAWIRIMPAAEIAAEIAADLDFLAAGSRALPERHRSLRTTFEHSWRLLGPAERTALRRLAVFAGGFTREAAAHVANAPLPVLASLVDRSLLRVSTTGRYDRHPLVHQYGSEKLAERPDERTEMRAAHARYYAELLSVPDLPTRRDRHRPELPYLAAEHDNLQAMWDWAIEQRDEKLVGRTLRNVTSYLAIQGRRGEASAWLERAVEAFPDTTWIRRLVRNRQGAFDLTLGRWRRARDRLEEARRLAGGRGDELEKAITLMQLGRVADMTGDYAAAQRLWESCRDIFRTLDRPIAVSEITHTLGLAAHHRGAWRQAIRLQRESLALKERLGYTPGIALGRSLLGDVYLDTGDLGAARDCYEASLDAYRTLQDEHGAAGARLGLARVAIRGGEPEAARAELAACLEVFEERADRIQQVRTLLALSGLEAALARPEPARERALEALELARRTELEPLILQALAHLTRVGDLDDVRRRNLLRWIVDRPTATATLKREVEAYLDAAVEAAADAPAARTGASATPSALDAAIDEVVASFVPDAPPV